MRCRKSPRFASRWRSTEVFRGYRALPVAFSGLLAFVAAGIQEVSLRDPAQQIMAYLGLWTGAAALSAFAAGLEMVVRSRVKGSAARVGGHMVGRRAIRALPGGGCRADDRLAPHRPGKLVDVAGPVAGAVQPRRVRLLSAVTPRNFSAWPYFTSRPARCRSRWRGARRRSHPGRWPCRSASANSSPRPSCIEPWSAMMTRNNAAADHSGRFAYDGLEPRFP